MPPDPLQYFFTATGGFFTPPSTSRKRRLPHWHRTPRLLSHSSAQRWQQQWKSWTSHGRRKLGIAQVMVGYGGIWQVYTIEIKEWWDMGYGGFIVVWNRWCETDIGLEKHQAWNSGMFRQDPRSWVMRISYTEHLLVIYLGKYVDIGKLIGHWLDGPRYRIW